mmetsp:Transcript_1490/g.2071  ORF Transcript_1490/g.2071 Transcript_1490/m.2071 type:complete len:101 (+) Transcript_1490:550-852(+)
MLTNSTSFKLQDGLLLARHDATRLLLFNSCQTENKNGYEYTSYSYEKIQILRLTGQLSLVTTLQQFQDISCLGIKIPNRSVAETWFCLVPVVSQGGRNQT